MCMRSSGCNEKLCGETGCKKAAAKTARWQGIAESAAKQSKRSLIPKVSEPVSYKEAVAYAMKLDQKLVPYENERGMAATREVVEAVRPGESIGIFIGPEGGLHRKKSKR